jgi:hypothetical protein
MPLNWKENYWERKPKTSTKVDFPILTKTWLDEHLLEAHSTGREFLKQRGIVLGRPGKIYISEPFIYFSDVAGLFAIRDDMRPNSDNRITYYSWANNTSRWSEHENMLAEA